MKIESKNHLYKLVSGNCLTKEDLLQLTCTGKPDIQEEAARILFNKQWLSVCECCSLAKRCLNAREIYVDVANHCSAYTFSPCLLELCVDALLSCEHIKYHPSERVEQGALESIHKILEKLLFERNRILQNLFSRQSISLWERELKQLRRLIDAGEATGETLAYYIEISGDFEMLTKILPCRDNDFFLRAYHRSKFCRTSDLLAMMQSYIAQKQKKLDIVFPRWCFLQAFYKLRSRSAKDYSDVDRHTLNDVLEYRDEYAELHKLYKKTQRIFWISDFVAKIRKPMKLIFN